MNLKIIILCLLTHATITPVIFSGIVESGVTKNNFLCSDASNASASSSIPCTDANTKTANFDMKNNPVLQIFNNQAFWLHQKAIAQQYNMQVLGYADVNLTSKMSSDGWDAMGGYCLIISTDPILCNIVKPTLVANDEQEKVVVQLWYNGDSAIQLWSQDAALLTKGATFGVTVSNTADDLIDLQTSTDTSLSAKFLSKLQLQPSNRKETTYQSATVSPRSVTITT